MSEKMKSDVRETEGAQSGEGAAAPVSSLARAIREGASDAADAASRVVPMLSGYLSKSLYGACYYATYSVVFGALTASRLLPNNGSAIHGIQDGARDARKAVDRREALEAKPQGSVS